MTLETRAPVNVKTTAQGHAGVVVSAGGNRDRLVGIHRRRRFFCSLSAAMRPADLFGVVDRFAAFAPTHFIHLDETSAFGPIINETCRTGLPVRVASLLLAASDLGRGEPIASQAA